MSCNNNVVNFAHSKLLCCSELWAVSRCCADVVIGLYSSVKTEKTAYNYYTTIIVTASDITMLKNVYPHLVT